MPGRGKKDVEGALLLALASGASAAAAARRADCSERTARRRLDDPAFRQRVQQARAEMVTRAVGRLSGDMGRAAATLRRLLTSDDDRVRLGAARAILETGSRMREKEEIEQRLSELEAIVRGGAKP